MLPQQVFSAYDGKNVASRSRYSYCPVCAAPLTDPGIDHPSRQQCGECGWVRYRNPSPGVVVAITEGDRVLLGKRGPTSFAAGAWCLPGGFVEFGEDFLSAALREVHEEAGLAVEICSILSVVSNFLSPDLHTLVIVLKARILGGTPVPGDDLEELRWYPMVGPFPPMAFEADRHIIERCYRTSLEGAPVDPLFARTFG